MQGLLPTKNTCRRLTWLSVGLCFVLLYSCPIKKYLLMTVAGGSATEASGSSLQKDFSGYGARIVYLGRRQTGHSVIGTVRAARPEGRVPFSAYMTGFSAADALAMNGLRSHPALTAGSPPGWELPLRI